VGKNGRKEERIVEDIVLLKGWQEASQFRRSTEHLARKWADVDIDLSRRRAAPVDTFYRTRCRGRGGEGEGMYVDLNKSTISNVRLIIYRRKKIAPPTLTPCYFFTILSLEKCTIDNVSTHLNHILPNITTFTSS